MSREEARDGRVMEAAMNGHDLRENGQHETAADETDAAPATEAVADLRERIATLQEEKAALEATVDDLRDQNRAILRRLTALEKQLDGEAGGTGQTELDKWVTAPDDMLDQLSTNKRRAVTLARNWTEIAWRRDKHAAWNVDTKSRANAKNHPSKLKYRLERHLDESLASMDVYRTMRQMALMSGGEPRVDEYDREHIEGGEFEFHERTTKDGQQTFKVLEEVTA